MTSSDDLDDARVLASLGRILTDGAPYTALPGVDPTTKLPPAATVDAIRAPLEEALTELDADVVQLQPAVASLETLVEDGRLSESNLAGTIGSVVAADTPGIVSPLITAGVNAARLLPTTLTTATQLAGKVYEPRLNLYNSKESNLRRSRAKLGAALANAGRMKIACVGDSITAGSAALPATTSYPAFLESILAARGYAISGQAVPLTHQASPTDARWTLQTGWNNFSSVTLFRRCQTAGATATYVSDRPGTIVEVRYLGTSAPFTVAIDGGSAVTVTPTGASASFTYSVTGLADTTHTVVITCPGTSNVYIIDAAVRRANGVSIGNFGLGSTTTVNTWALTSFLDAPVLVADWAADLTVVMTGTNDKNTSVTPAAYKTALTAAVTRFQATGDVLLVHPIPGSGLSFTDYSPEIYDVAATRDVPLLDMHARWGSYSTANSNGQMADTLHPVPNGYADIASAVAAALIN